MYANEYMITLRHLFVEFVSPLGKGYDQDEEGESQVKAVFTTSKSLNDLKKKCIAVSSKLKP